MVSKTITVIDQATQEPVQIKLYQNPDGSYSEAITGSNSLLKSGSKTVAIAGTREALGGNINCKSVIITANETNGGIIAVGGDDVIAIASNRKGTPLRGGDSFVIEIDNLSKVYLDTEVSGEGVTYTYIF